MTRRKSVRGCVWAAASTILNGDPVTSDAGGKPPGPDLLAAVEDTYQAHRRELDDGRGGVNWRRLAELHRDRMGREPTLF